MNSKILTILTAVFSVIGILFFVWVATAGDDPADLASPVSNYVNYGVALLIIAVIAAVGGSLFGLFKNPAALKKALFGIVALGALVIIAYLIANGNEVVDANNKIIAAKDSSVSRLTSTGIWVSTFLLIISGGIFVADLLKGLIKS